MKKLINWLLNFIYPRFCYGCGNLGEFLCDKCHQQLNFLIESNLAGELKKIQTEDNKGLDSLKALLVYDDLLAKILHQYKYNGVKDLCQIFSHWLYQYLDLPKVDFVAYIPVHPKRLDERGYNQAKLIAELLAEKMGLQCLPLLKRTIYRENQALSKNKNERINKAQKIFAIQKTINEKVKEKTSILIVDDVVTTGITLEEAAKILKINGWKKVIGVAVAHGS